MSRSGFTLIEITFVFAVIALLMVTIIAAVPKNISRAKDGRKKDDLSKLKVALEDYYNDNGVYPDRSVLSTCGAGELQPYLATVMCESGSTPYTYVTSADKRCYALYTKLQVADDPDITRVGCVNGCGPDRAYNYSVSNTSIQ